MNKKSLFLILIIFIVANLNILININDFVYLKNSDYSDIAITHYPNLFYIQQGIIADHEIPLWSNLIQSGYPLVENPLSGIWYMWGWIALLFPLPMGININLLLHILLGILGMYLFLRIEGRSEFASIFGATGFGLCVKMYSHFGAGHLSMIYAVNWTIWLLYFTKISFIKKKLVFQLLPGLILGFILTADPRWIIPASLLWVLYFLNIKERLSKKLYIFIASSLTGLLTSIGLWYSLLHFLQYSTRSTLNALDRNIYALDFPDLLGFFFPEYGGFSEWVLYPSALILLSLVIGIFIYKENKEIRFWYFVILFSLLFSFGDQIPGLRYLFAFPGFSLLRVPSRFIWLVFISYPIISSFVIDYLLLFTNKYKFDRLFFLVIVVVFILFFDIGYIFITHSLPSNLIFSVIFFGFGTLLFGLALHNKINTKFMKIGFLSLLVFDLAIINFNSLKFYDTLTILNQKPDLINLIKTMPKYARIYTPSYSLTQEEAAFWNINQINGIDPMQLSEYVNYFSKASGVKHDNYSVTLPSFINGNPITANKMSCPDLEKIIKLNVGFVISDFELTNCDGFKDPQFVNNKFVYKTKFIFQVAYFESGIDGVSLEKYSANQISLSSNQGGRLVFSELFYPGWKAFVDGQEIQIGKKDIFRYIDLASGKHFVELKFKPDYVNYVLLIQILSLLVVLFLLIWENINVHKEK